MSTISATELAQAISLFKSASIPLYTCLTSLTWILYEYFDTLVDEITYIWPGRHNLGKLLFFIIRYYTILLAIFDVAQIHSFSHFNPSLETCVVMDAMIRVVGAISLWTVEIIMQLRIYVLYGASKRVAYFNGFLFLMSIGGFIWILAHNALGRAAVIGSAKALPIPGCPVVHTGIEWAQWVPATIFEGVLFMFALGKGARTAIANFNKRANTYGLIYTILLHDNVLYFFGVAALLILNNLMVVGATKIPWFSYGPFHVAIGIMTCRMLMHLHKALVRSRVTVTNGTIDLPRCGASRANASSELTVMSDAAFACDLAYSYSSVPSNATMSWFARSGTETVASDGSGWGDSKGRVSWAPEKASGPRVRVVEISPD